MKKSAHAHSASIQNRQFRARTLHARNVAISKESEENILMEFFILDNPVQSTANHNFWKEVYSHVIFLEVNVYF